MSYDTEKLQGANVEQFPAPQPTGQVPDTTILLDEMFSLLEDDFVRVHQAFGKEIQTLASSDLKESLEVVSSIAHRGLGEYIQAACESNSRILEEIKPNGQGIAGLYDSVLAKLLKEVFSPLMKGVQQLRVSSEEVNQKLNLAIKTPNSQRPISPVRAYQVHNHNGIQQEWSGRVGGEAYIRSVAKEMVLSNFYGYDIVIRNIVLEAEIAELHREKSQVNDRLPPSPALTSDSSGWSVGPRPNTTLYETMSPQQQICPTDDHSQHDNPGYKPKMGTTQDYSSDSAQGDQLSDDWPSSHQESDTSSLSGSHDDSDDASPMAESSALGSRAVSILKSLPPAQALDQKRQELRNLKDKLLRFRLKNRSMRKGANGPEIDQCRSRSSTTSSISRLSTTSTGDTSFESEQEAIEVHNAAKGNQLSLADELSLVDHRTDGDELAQAMKSNGSSPERDSDKSGHGLDYVRDESCIVEPGDSFLEGDTAADVFAMFNNLDPGYSSIAVPPSGTAVPEETDQVDALSAPDSRPSNSPFRLSILLSKITKLTLSDVLLLIQVLQIVFTLVTQLALWREQDIWLQGNGVTRNYLLRYLAEDSSSRWLFGVDLVLAWESRPVKMAHFLFSQVWGVLSKGVYNGILKPSQGPQTPWGQRLVSSEAASAKRN